MLGFLIFPSIKSIGASCMMDVYFLMENQYVVSTPAQLSFESIKILISS